MNKFCITGVPGVGKSSVIGELKKRGFKAFDVDSLHGLCHWEDASGEKSEYHPGIGKGWLDTNSYFCDIAKLRGIINENEGIVIVAGIVDNQDEFLDLFDEVFLFRCDEKIFLDRLDTRDTNDFARDESEQEHVLGYYKDFEAQMLRRGAVPIDTDASLKNVVDKIILEIQNLSQSRTVLD